MLKADGRIVSKATEIVYRKSMAKLYVNLPSNQNQLQNPTN